MRRPADQLLPAGAEGGEARQQLVQLQALSAVLRQLLPDLLHLRRHRRGLPQALHRPLQRLQQRVHFIVELWGREERGEELQEEERRVAERSG